MGRYWLVILGFCCFLSCFPGAGKAMEAVEAGSLLYLFSKVVAKN